MNRVATSIWPVPGSFLDVEPTPERSGWVATLGRRAAELAESWQLRLDGDPRHGWQGVVWPVRDGEDQALVLKLAAPDPLGQGEGAALEAWAGRGVAQLVRRDPAQRAMLMERLDPDRWLVPTPIDEACAVIGGVLAEMAGAVPPPEVVLLADELAEWLERLDRLSRSQTVLPPALVDCARETMAAQLAECLVPDAAIELLHFDLHYQNVLHTAEGAERPGWRAIDPLPVTGTKAWELVAPLRNRFEDAAATGDPDRALRRRVDQICERSGIDPVAARACAQAAAVDNLLSTHPGNPDSIFNPPFSVMASWTGG